MVKKMLLEALKQISKMQVYSLSQLANELKIDRSMASHIIDQLKVMGYIKEEVLSTVCNGECKQCAGCPVANGATPIKTLTITAKGSRALNL
ncbi:FeoC-like transcriptional regulator [Tepidanaerobacter sp. EBM-38]|uniref:FeoC-like transcriptional regulator n=1 Tax=Tepidanaerobacter sp. EBM-38 TaxID=1918496 RepID=UPI0025FFF010|nr:FeoC-like transcriptional regulator [Tepidanaerobacter sp. EBM-38]